MIFGERVLQAREMRDLSQQQLAEKVRCTQTTIAKVEADIRQPSAGLMSALASELGFPIPWFERPIPSHFPLGSLQFRAKAAKSQRQLHKPYYVARTVFEVAEALRSRVKTLPIRLQRDICWDSPAEAASALRSECGLAPDAPIDDVVHLIERLGVVVLGLPLDLELEGVDGFSAWTADGTPVICLSMLAPGDRLRYTAGHELGELAMSAMPIADRHDAADAFAGEFLLPENAMRRELVPPVSLTSLAQLKLRWRVSMAFLATRAARLDIISNRHLRTLFVEISKRGWRKHEPENLAVETERPRVVRKMAEVLYGNPLDFERFALDCRITPIFARRLVQAHLPKPKTAQSGVLSVDFGARRRAREKRPAFPVDDDF